MKKKTLGRIAALSIAAVSAVPTFSIAASAAEVGVTSISVFKIITGFNNGTPVYSYYDTEAHANNNAITGSDGSQSTASSATSVPYITNGDKFYFDPRNGELKEVTSSDPAPEGVVVYVYNGTNSSSSSSSSNYYGYHYATDQVYYSSSTNRYYPNRQAYYADSRNSGTTPTVTDLTSNNKWNSSHRYFNYIGGYYTNVESGNTEYIYGYYGSGYYSQYVIPSGYTYASNTSYYSPETGTWYPNLEALRAAVGYNTTNYSTKTPASYSHAYSSTNHYFNPEDGLYYSSSGGHRVNVSSGTTSTTYRYYSVVTGQYYNTYNEALTASGGVTSYVRTISSNSYYYDDPYYYYYYYGLGGSTTTAATNDTSKVKIGKYTGWTTVTKVINSARSGATYAVEMNTETEIPTSVLTALKGKNVNIQFKFSNGAYITLNGNDITSTAAISPVIKYGQTSIPSSLKKKAVKANSGVSSSQFTINGGSFGASASVTIKFNTKRAGCSAKLYRYNASANTLSLVSRSAVQSNGLCTFDDVKQGGEYIVVLS